MTLHVTLSRQMAPLAEARIGALEQDIAIGIIDPAKGIPGDLRDRTQVLFLSSDLIEAFKYHPDFAAECAGLIESAPLQWVQSGSSGYERPIFSRILDKGIRFTTGAGIHSVPIAQYVLSHMLAHVKLHLQHALQQQAHVWQQLPQGELGCLTAGILGFGTIGCEIARLCKAFGMRVVGLRRSPELPADVDGVYHPSEIGAFIGQSDFLIVALPQTPETERLIGESELAAMKPDAVLINIARGSIIDEDALVEGLRLGRPSHAVLDVAAVEPLPAGSPLWDMPNVTITPHDSAWSPLTYQRLADLFCHNLAQFIAGREMRNEVEARSRCAAG